MANQKDTSIDGNLTLNGDISVLPGGGSTTKIWDSKVNKWTFYNDITTMDLNCSTTLSSSSIKTNNLTIGNNIMDDFVIDRGTNGIWTYRKWNSGVKECWGSINQAYNFSRQATSPSGFYTQNNNGTSQTLPSGLFTSSPKIQITTALESGWYPFFPHLLTFSNSSFKYRIWSGTGGTSSAVSNVTCNFYVIGT